MLFVDRNHDANTDLRENNEKHVHSNQYPQFTKFRHFSFEISHNSHFNTDWMILDVKPCVRMTPVD